MHEARVSFARLRVENNVLTINEIAKPIRVIVYWDGWRVAHFIITSPQSIRIYFRGSISLIPADQELAEEREFEPDDLPIQVFQSNMFVRTADGLQVTREGEVVADWRAYI